MDNWVRGTFYVAHAHLLLLSVVFACVVRLHEKVSMEACSKHLSLSLCYTYFFIHICSYQDYKCPKGEEHMECDVDPNMDIVAVTNAKWYGGTCIIFRCVTRTLMSMYLYDLYGMI